MAKITPKFAAALVSIVVTPVAPTIVAGNTVQMIATGNYSDGSKFVLSSSIVSWKSSSPAVGTVNNNGLVTGVAYGSAIITAYTPSISGISAVIVSGAAPVPPLPVPTANTTVRLSQSDDGATWTTIFQGPV